MVQTKKKFSSEKKQGPASSRIEKRGQVRPSADASRAGSSSRESDISSSSSSASSKNAPTPRRDTGSRK